MYMGDVVLVDFRCSSIILSQKMYQMWQKQCIDVITIANGIGSICLWLWNGRAVVMAVDPLGFNRLLGINAIDALGGVSISRSGEVQFPHEQASAYIAAAALFIKGPDFQVKFNWQWNEWTALWKWVECKAFGNCKTVSQYSMPAKVRRVYE